MQYAYGFIQTSVESYGELSFESAQAYYEYGNALLTKEEENPSNQILNNVEDENDDAEDENEDNDNDDEGEKQQESDAIKKYVEDEPEGDFQIAWESLDVTSNLFILHFSFKFLFATIYYNRQLEQSFKNSFQIEKIKSCYLMYGYFIFIIIIIIISYSL